MSIIFTGNKQSISKRQHNHLNTSTGNNVNPCDKMSKHSRTGQLNVALI